MFKLAVVLGLPLLGLNGCGEQPQPATELREPGSWTEVLLTEGDPLPCEASVVPTGVRFEADPDLSVPDITQALSRLPDGRYLSSTEEVGVLAEWDADGRFVRRLGQAGDGPEEFRMVLAILTDPRHEVAVMHPPNMTRLNQDLEIVDRRLVPALTGPPTQNLGGPDGSWVFVGFHPQNPVHLVHVLDEHGELVRSFRPVEESELGWTGTSLSTARYESVESFWVGPAQRVAGEWVLEHWTPGGDLLQVIRRRAEWLESPQLRGGPHQFYPRYSVTPYSDGILMVWTANWDHRRSSPDDPEPRYRWDFVDTEHGRLLASLERDVTPGSGPHRLGGFFPNQKLGFFREATSNGLVDIVEAEIRLTCNE